MSTGIGGTFVSTIYQLADGVVTTEKLANKAVTTEKIDDEAVTGDQIQQRDMVTGERIGGCRDWNFAVATALYWTLSNNGASSAATMIAGDPGHAHLACRGTAGEYGKALNAVEMPNGEGASISGFFLAVSNLTGYDPAKHKLSIQVSDGVATDVYETTTVANGPQLWFTVSGGGTVATEPCRVTIVLEGLAAAADVCSVDVTQIRVQFAYGVQRNIPLVVV